VPSYLAVEAATYHGPAMTDPQPPAVEPEDARRHEALAPALVGTILILVGALFLGAQLLDIDVGEVGWPFFVIIPGVVSLALGFVLRGAAGLIIGGSVVTMVGLVLLYQNTTGHWESWAYAWALVGPGGSGIGSVLAGTRERSPGLVRAGLWQIVVGLTLLAAGLFFFEGLIGISGEPLSLPNWLLPAVVIAAGVVLLLRGATARRETSP
jgi:hypothetical protein